LSEHKTLSISWSHYRHYPKRIVQGSYKRQNRWDLWENDFRVVIAYSKDDAELKFTEMTGFNEHYYIESIEKIVLSDIEKILLEN
ncbi:TPA: hypothetical protein ACRO4Y_004359, partial [Escherichia coli]